MFLEMYLKKKPFVRGLRETIWEPLLGCGSWYRCIMVEYAERSTHVVRLIEEVQRGL